MPRQLVREYRDRANNARDRAFDARTEVARRSLILIAETWDQMAQLEERLPGALNSDPERAVGIRCGVSGAFDARRAYRRTPPAVDEPSASSE
jgi:hypothetical protein